MTDAARGAGRAAPAVLAGAPADPPPAGAVRPWALDRGARVLGDGSVRFAVWAPRAERVEVVTDAAPSEVGALPPPGEAVDLEPRGDGLFAGAFDGAAPGMDYRYRLDGRIERADPVSRFQPRGVHGPSRVVDPLTFGWSDAAWSGIETAALAIYELHVGAFTAEGTFDTAIERLPDLVELGVTAIEILPVAQFPGSRNWGYDGVFPYAPQDSYGGPDGLRRLVDAAHGEGLAVILDVVYNHLGPEGNVLADFGPYFTDHYRTPWGEAVNFDGPGSDEVRRYVIDNARYWVAEFHVDGLRLDAVHAIYDFSARHVLEELASEVHALAACLGRRVQVIAESDLNDPRLVREAERGGYGLDAQWSDDFHHAVHAVLTGERGGYYADFGGVEPIATALAEGFVYGGRYSRYRRRRHGAPAHDVPGDRFVICLQNHDQVGNRARGDRLSTLVGPAELRLAAALLLLAPYVPLLFMGEEYGETNPFLYFVSHLDPDLVHVVRAGRAREFEAFAWPDEIPDPQAEETFRRSHLRPKRAAREPGASLLRLYRDLLRLRREEPALRPGAARVAVSSEPREGWIALSLGEPGGRDLLAAFNLSGTPARIAAPAGTAPGPWRLALSSDDARYGGSGRTAPARPARSADGLELPGVPAHTALLYRRVAPSDAVVARKSGVTAEGSAASPERLLGLRPSTRDRSRAGKAGGGAKGILPSQGDDGSGAG